MDGQTIVGIVAAGIALMAMGVTIWQAVIAKRQSKHAEEQVAEAKKANALTEQMISEEREAHRFWLDLSAYPEKRGDSWFLVLKVANNSQKSANVQGVTLVFGDGSRLEEGEFLGQIALTKGQLMNGNPWLPGQLEAGRFFTFIFQQFHFSNQSRQFLFVPDYGQAQWRKISHIEVMANNQIFKLTGEEGTQRPSFWKSQFETMQATQQGGI